MSEELLKSLERENSTLKDHVDMLEEQLVRLKDESTSVAKSAIEKYETAKQELDAATSQIMNLKKELNLKEVLSEFPGVDPATLSGDTVEELKESAKTLTEKQNALREQIEKETLAKLKEQGLLKADTPMVVNPGEELPQNTMAVRDAEFKAAKEAGDAQGMALAKFRKLFGA